MIETIVIHSLVVFAITLTVTKSKIMGCKRQFVQDRYDAVLDNEETPCFLHEWFHAIWTCPMCSGFWVSLATSFGLYDSWQEIAIGTLCAYGLNWLLHCVEDFLYISSEEETIGKETSGNDN